jgi:predicted phage-related endonuclease
LLGGSIPDKYQVQMLWQMACTGRDYCDFVSYDPRLPEKMRMFVKRLERDDKRIKELEAMVEAFLDEVEAKVLALKAKFYPIELAA